MVQVDLMTLIGFVSGLTSIAILIYIAGYKLGRVDKSLEDLRILPNEVDKLIARVDILWESFMRSFHSKNPPSEEEASKAIMNFAKNFGLNVKKLELYRLVRREVRKEGMFKVSKLTEVKPPTWMLMEAELEKEHKDMKLVTTFYVNENGKIEKEEMTLKLEPHQVKSDVARMMFSSYLKEVGRFLLTIVEMLLRH